MNNTALITSLYAELKKRAEVRSLIPMGYTPGIPMLSIQNEHLVAIVPFLRYKATGTVDHTLVFPIRFVMEFSLPDGRLIRYRDLAFESNYADVVFGKAVGFFRHEAIKHLDKAAYGNFRAQTLAKFDKLTQALISDQPYTENDDLELRKALQTIVEPSLLAFYKAIDTDFYEKYLKI